MIVHPPRVLPPTKDERDATRRARVARWFRHVCTVAAVLAPLVLALALYVAQRGETGWALTAGLGCIPLFAAAVKRLSDDPPAGDQP